MVDILKFIKSLYIKVNCKLKNVFKYAQCYIKLIKMCLMFNVTNVSNVIIMIKMKIGLMSLLSINKSE